MLGIATATAAPSMAASTVYGSAQLKYTVNATASISIAVNYDVNGAIQPAAASTILASAAGNCTGRRRRSVERDADLRRRHAAAAGFTSCYYKNALSIGVNSNDSAGVQVMEYIDVPRPARAICAYRLNAAPPDKPTQSAATAIAGQNTCAAPRAVPPAPR